MTPKTREDFELESGGFLNAVDGAIAEAVFEEASGDYVDAMIAGDPNAKPGVMLRLTINVPDVDKPVSQAWSVGGAEQMVNLLPISRARISTCSGRAPGPVPWLRP